MDTYQDDSFESSNSKVDLMHKWQPYMTPINVNTTSNNMLQYNYPNTNEDFRSNQIYHSDLFSPEDGINVKRARRYDPSSEFLPAPNPIIDSNYCCCKSKKQCIRVSALSIFLVSISLGLVLFFCWPRIPQFTVSKTASDLKGISYASTNSNNNHLLALKGATASVPFRASMSFSVPVIVNSSNYIDISVSSIIVSIKILNGSGMTIPFLDGSGEVTKIIISKQKSTTIYFVSLYYI